MSAGRALLLLLAALAPALAACDLSMFRQPKSVAQAPAPLFSGGAEVQPPIPDTLAQGEAAEQALGTSPPPATPASLARGREQFGVFCKPCHGPAGNADGTIVGRGFPKPPSLHDPRLMRAPGAHLYDVISNGYGVMYAYGDRLAPADRWAVVAYVRALQLSRAGEGARGGSAR